MIGFGRKLERNRTIDQKEIECGNGRVHLPSPNKAHHSPFKVGEHQDSDRAANIVKTEVTYGRE